MLALQFATTAAPSTFYARRRLKTTPDYRLRGSSPTEASNKFREAVRHVGSAVLGCAAAAALALSSPSTAVAETVRLRDVENAGMQAGVRAATEGNFRDAEKYFEAVLREDDRSASAWSNMGNVHLQQQRAELALEDFTRATELAPRAPVPLLNRALAEEQLGVNASQAGRSSEAQQHFQHAIQDCQAAIDRDPREFAAWFNKGNVEMRLEQFDAAMQSFHRAADLAPGIAGYRLREAEMLFQQDETAKADTLMRTVIRKYPNYAEAHAALAAVRWAEGDLAKAEGEFNAATASESRYRDMQFVRQSTRWPPKLYEAMQKFLSMS